MRCLLIQASPEREHYSTELRISMIWDSCEFNAARLLSFQRESIQCQLDMFLELFSLVDTLHSITRQQNRFPSRPQRM